MTSPDEPLLASTASTTRVASAAPSSSQSDEGFFSSLARKVGLGNATADTTVTAASAPAAPPAKPKAEAKRNNQPPRPEGAIPATATAAAAPKTDTKQAAARPPLKPTVADTAAAPAPAAPAAGNSLVAGAQPIVSSNSFDSRFSAAK